MRHSVKIIAILLGLSLSGSLYARPGDKEREKAAQAEEQARRAKIDKQKQITASKNETREREARQKAVNKYVGALKANGGVAPKWAQKSEGAKIYGEIDASYKAAKMRNKQALEMANYYGVDTAEMQQQMQAGLAAGKLASGGFIVQNVEAENVGYQNTLNEAQKKFGPLPSSVADELAGKSEAEQRAFLEEQRLIPSSRPTTVRTTGTDRKVARMETEEEEGQRITNSTQKPVASSSKGLPSGAQGGVQNGLIIPTEVFETQWAKDEMDRIEGWANSTFVASLNGVPKRTVDFTATVDLVDANENSQQVTMRQWSFLNSTNRITNVTYTNGIENTHNEATKTAAGIAGAVGGVVTLVYNPTMKDLNNNNVVDLGGVGTATGLIGDGGNTVLCQVNLCLETAAFKLQDMLRLSKGNLLMTAHSEGTTIMSNAIDRYINEGGDVSHLEVIAAGAVDSINTKVKTHYVYETNDKGSNDRVAALGKTMPLLTGVGAFEYGTTNAVIGFAAAGLLENQDYTRINSGAACANDNNCHSSGVIAQYLKVTGATTPTYVENGTTYYGNTVLTKSENSGKPGDNVRTASYYCVESGSCSERNKVTLNLNEPFSPLPPSLTNHKKSLISRLLPRVRSIQASATPIGTEYVP